MDNIKINFFAALPTFYSFLVINFQLFIAYLHYKTCFVKRLHLIDFDKLFEPLSARRNRDRNQSSKDNNINKVPGPLCNEAPLV